jgi:hypothetical protein
MIRIRSLLPFATACVLLAACDPPTTISTLPTEFATIPTVVQVDGRELTLEAHLWRDFQPVAPPDGWPLVAVLFIKTTDGSAFPAGVTADQVKVVYGEQVWTAPTRQEHPSSQPGVLEVVAREGPKWGPHVNVDVVVRLRGTDGEVHLVRAPGQRIGRTD